MQQESYPTTGYTPDYQSYTSGGGDVGGYMSGGFKQLNGLELIVLILSLCAVIISFVWGVFASNTGLRDNQREAHILQVLSALDQFYVNSNLDPTNRKYPVAVCSNSLNEVDYELTLRLYLTGQQVAFDKHAYIAKDDYPRDPWGDYATQFADKKTPFRCSNILPQGNATDAYFDQYPSCDFSPVNNLRSCYVFTSSVNGDSFQLGYWSEVANSFVVYSRFRSEQVTRAIVTI